MSKKSPAKLGNIGLGHASGASQLSPPASRDGFCIFINTIFEGSVPSVREAGKPCVFATEVDAQREIADNMITRLQEFIDGERTFEEALALEEYVVKVRALPDGSVVDAYGVSHGAGPS